MSLSLRDQLLQAGLVSQKQARDAERQLQRQEQLQRQQPKHPRAKPQSQATPQPQPTPQSRPTPHAQQHPPQPKHPHERGPTADLVSARIAQSAKIARDQALNRRQQEKAQKKALQAQIKQLIEQNRLPQADTDEDYNFVDGNKIRRVKVNAATRGPLSQGAIVIVRHEGRYDLVPAALGARIRERDESAVIPIVATESVAADDAYQGFSVPDDLIW